MVIKKMSKYYIKLGNLYLDFMVLDQYYGNTKFIYNVHLSADKECCISYKDIEEAANVACILEDILGGDSICHVEEEKVKEEDNEEA